MKKILVIAALTVLYFTPAIAPASADDLGWAEPTQTNRPWTRWWWLGSAVDKPNLTDELTQFKQAGIGGVEICPIYGVKGYEDHHIDFLSPKWMEMLAHTLREGERLGVGVDMTTGTGWPFGGPHVTTEDASASVILNRYTLAGGETLESLEPQSRAGRGRRRPPQPGQLLCLRAVSDDGRQIDLAEMVDGDRLDWTAPDGQWTLYSVSMRSPVQQVKRAAPGGEGNVLDPYSVEALNHYLSDFDQAFANYHDEMPRAQFHDSFEYYGATWTSDFFQRFENRRGYDLRTQLPALFGDGPDDAVARVKADYRETIAELHLAYVRRWTEWSHGHGSLTRNQAHGAPANLIDLYAAVDIPETEIFGSIDEEHIPMQKFASSAANLTGRALTSSESFTWLNEHFQTTLDQVKQAADYLFIAGINHIFFHGIPYSPKEAPWPGWQFYAAVNFGPQGGLWRDLPAFTAYVARCQSVLQSGAAANDVLLYFPLSDLFHTPDGMLLTFTVHNVERWLQPHPFYDASVTMWKRGYTFDYLSDQFLAQAKVENHKIVLGKHGYRVLVVPHARFMPEASLKKLADLARAGATIVFQGGLPEDVPGFGDLANRRAEFKQTLSSLGVPSDASGMTASTLGFGRILLGAELEDLLQEAGVSREPVVDRGIRFVRRTHPEGYHYFLANRGDEQLDGWVTLGVPAQSAVILDPRFENRTGVAAVRKNTDGASQVYLQLNPGESLVLRTFSNKTVEGSAWVYTRPADETESITGEWQVQFVDGGPELPGSFETSRLASWTELGDDEAKRFAGAARYTIEFDHPDAEADGWRLDLGRVAESARVRLNGRDVGTLWAHPFSVAVGKFLKPGANTLEVEVTNLAANRVRDLDRREVNWKYFYDINVVGKNYRSLNAANWPLRDSGLLGPVTLHALRTISPQ